MSIEVNKWLQKNDFEFQISILEKRLHQYGTYIIIITQ